MIIINDCLISLLTHSFSCQTSVSAPGQFPALHLLTLQQELWRHSGHIYLKVVFLPWEKWAKK